MELVRGQIAARGLLPDGFSARPRPGGRGLFGTGSRHGAAQVRQANILPGAVARFALRPRRATGSKQRENVEHASALKALPKRAEWNRPHPFINLRGRLRPCRSSDEGRHIPNRFQFMSVASQAGRSAAREKTRDVIFSLPYYFSPRRYFSLQCYFSLPCCFFPHCCADQEGLAARLEICHRPGRRPFSTRRW